MSQQKTPILTTTVTAAATLSEFQAVGYDGNVAAAAAAIMGLVTTDAAQGDAVSVDRLGTSIAIASGAISKGDQLEVGAGGALTALAAGIVVARAEQDAADGERFEVILLPK
jgi:hypothetical protein